MERKYRSRLLSTVVTFSIIAGLSFVFIGYQRSERDQEPTVHNVQKIQSNRVDMATFSTARQTTDLAELNSSGDSNRRAAEHATSNTETAVHDESTIELTLLQKISALRAQPTAESVRILSSYLDHPNLRVASEAIEVMSFIALTSNQEETVLEILSGRASDPNYILRGIALYTAARIGKDKLLPIVSNYIENPDKRTQPETYDAAVRALVAIRSPQSVAHLRALLAKAKNPEVRRNSFETLANIKTPESIEVLMEYIKSAPSEDQTAAVAALARMEDPQAVQFLSEALESQQLTPETIERLSYNPGAPDIFSNALRSQILPEKQKIVLLDHLAENSVEGNDEMRNKMKDRMMEILDGASSLEIKSRALKVIGEMGTQDAPSILLSYIEADEGQLRDEAFSNFIAYTSPTNYSALYPFIWDENADTRRTAMLSIEQFAGQQDIELLQKASRHEDQFIRNHANSILSRLHE